MDALAELLRPLLGSAAVLGALLVVRRRVAGGARLRPSGALRVAERVAVGRTTSVVVVEVDARRFLLGAGEHGVRLLGELGPPRETAGTVDGALTWSRRAPADAAPAADADPRLDLLVRTDADPDHQPEGPRSGPLDRLRRATVRTHVEAPLRELT